VDAVDRKDKKIGTIAKDIAHSKGTIHRAAHVFVFNKKGEIFLQKRSKRKLLAPGLLDSSCAGHVLAGESYQKAAARELKEELGIKKAKAKFLFKSLFIKKTRTYHNREIIALFELDWNGKVKISSEASSGKWIMIAKLRKEIREKPGAFGSAFLKLFRKFLKLKKA